MACKQKKQQKKMKKKKKNPDGREQLWQCMAERNDWFHLLRQALHQLGVYVVKARPLLGVPPPAAQHEIVVDSIGTTGRLRQIHLGARVSDFQMKTWKALCDKDAEESPNLCDAYLLALVPEELACVFNDLLVGELGVGLLLAQSQNLPQSHAKGPHVTGHGELPLREQTT